MTDTELREQVVVTLYNASDERDNKSVGQAADQIMQLFKEHTEREVQRAEARVIRLAAARSSGTITVNHRYICNVCSSIADDLGDLLTSLNGEETPS